MNLSYAYIYIKPGSYLKSGCLPILVLDLSNLGAEEAKEIACLLEMPSECQLFTIPSKNNRVFLVNG